jgi:3',5'-cyclic AMP phosphodiesterase CpdA
MPISKRDFLKLTAYGGAVFASGLYSLDALAKNPKLKEFYFVQLSDTHWGFNDTKFNADPKGTLPKAIEMVNKLSPQPDFVVFTGDLIHTVDDPIERRKRLKEFKDVASKLKAKVVRFMPGEHDASLDNGEAYKELFGDLNYTFDHKGIHFIALDNVSDPRATLGDKQLAWLKQDLSKRKKDSPIVVLAHRPLFDLAPKWDWATADGSKAIDLLMPFKNVTVFYGHIHQEHHHMTGHIAHHAAKSLIFPLTVPGSAKDKSKGLWNPADPYQGLGIRNIEAHIPEAKFDLYELGIKQGIKKV